MPRWFISYSSALIVAAVSFSAIAEEKLPYPNELENYKLFETAKWKTLRPLVSTMADVRKVMGEPTEAKDLAHYSEKYPGDDAAVQPIFRYEADDHWQIIIYFVKSDLSSPEKLRARVPDLLYRIDLIPKQRVSFKEVAFPQAFNKKKVIAADASWNAYADGLGLVYQVYTKARYGTYEAGDLNRISYGPSDDAIKKVVDGPAK